MYSWFRRGLILLYIASGLALSARAAAPDPVGEAEASRLYERANDYVSAVHEGEYSYAYLQFYWKRAQSNIDRIIRVYPDTTVGRALRSSELKVGPFSLAYFKDRVLARVEEKQVAAKDAINCAIFLGEVKGSVWDATRRAATLRIIEVLARQQRWSEALQFNNIEESYRPLKVQTVFEVAARFEQADLVKDLLAVAPKDELPRYHAILAEAMALRGLPRAQIASLIAADNAPEVRLAALRGMITREVQIRRTAALRLPMNTIYFAGDILKNPSVRDDVVAAAHGFFPTGNAEADDMLAGYRAALGEKPAPTASNATRLAYVEYLAAFEKFDEIPAYSKSGYISAADRAAIELKYIELLARAGRTAAAAKAVAAFSTGGTAASDAAVYAEFRGAMDSSEVPLVVHERTFANLPLHDPSLLAQAMMDWSLTPNRSIRGAAPYDAVVDKFSPGFANLAAPLSSSVQEAASTQKPY